MIHVLNLFLATSLLCFASSISGQSQGSKSLPTNLPTEDAGLSKTVEWNNALHAFLEGLCVSVDSTSVDCANMSILVQCMDRNDLGTDGIACHSDGACVITLGKTGNTDEVLPLLPKLCDQNVSVDEFKDILDKIRDLIKSGKSLKDWELNEIIRILFILVHEKQHCSDRCHNPGMRSCESEISATLADIAEMKKLAEDLKCERDRLLKGCTQTIHFIDISTARLSFVQCVCENSSDCTKCVDSCKKSCETALYPAVCSNYCERLPRSYCTQ